MGCGASKESTPRGPKATAGPEMQSALVFVKPHANTPAVNDLVKSKFAEQGINIVTDGVIDGCAQNRLLSAMHPFMGPPPASQRRCGSFECPQRVLASANLKRSTARRQSLTRRLIIVQQAND